jgi:signal transduction histidine kinase
MLAARADRAPWNAEPEGAKHFVEGLSGPGALDLVVEMVHDLRSPLTSILWLTETLMRGDSGVVNEMQRRHLGVVYGAAMSLNAITNDVMELAGDGGKLLGMEPAAFSSREVVESVADMVRPIAEQKRVDVRTLVADDDRRIGHRSALSRVLLNLTTNALNATDEGYVEMSATPAGARGLAFSVRDTGRGMTPDAVETLYQPFRPSRTRAEPVLCGTGLGLRICQKLLKAMGSTLEVETRPGWGTRFHFELALPSASAPRPF